MTTQPPIAETSEPAEFWFALSPDGDVTQHVFASHDEANQYRRTHNATVWRPTLHAATLALASDDDG